MVHAAWVWSADVVACECTGEPKAQALKCSKEEAHGTGTSLGWHKAMLESMAQSRFCMIVPGDSQSSQRLSDAFVTGVCASSDVSNRLHQHAPSASDIISSLSFFVVCSTTAAASRSWYGTC